MENVFEQAKFTDIFLRELYQSSVPISLATAIEKKKLPSDQNREKFKMLEYILEELELVEFVRGRDNSTLDGQCEYRLAKKGRKLVEDNESSNTLFIIRELKDNPIYDEKSWEEYYDKRLENRANEADYFLDIIIDTGIINLDKSTIRKYFKEWFKENHEFDLQIKNGDLAIEDGDFQTVPDFKKENIPEFIKWFEKKGNDFIDYLKQHGVEVKDNSKKEIINHGNLIYNENSKIKKQVITKEKEQKESSWSKANVIIALIVGIVTIIGIVWQMFK